MPGPAAPRLLLAAALSTACLAACDGGAGEAPQARFDRAPVPTAAASFELTWQGVLPCADCDGIDTRLVLRREDGTRDYALVETFLGAGDGARFEQRGNWRQQDRDSGLPVYRLGPAGAERAFGLREDGSLEPLDSRGEPLGEGPAYRLQRM